MSQLSLQQIVIQYAQQAVIHDISLQIEHGLIGCLLGPSGCGKTTLLRAIAGFEPVAEGKIALGDTVISSPRVHVPPEKRQIGMVFQDYALFPHLTIANNISFGIRHLSKSEQAKRIAQLLELVSLSGYEKRYPHELSGGQQQRIALARALAPKPKLMLLDEPFGSQDVELREMLAREVRDILKQEKTTAILVTHDQHEAFAMADEIGVLKSGRLQQWATPYELYHRPANAFVAEFIGQGVLIKGEVLDNYTVHTALGIVSGELPQGSEPKTPLKVLIRPDDIRLVAKAERKATVIGRVFRGAQYLYTLQLPDQVTKVLALVPSHQEYDMGETVSLELDMQHLVLVP
ncbi:MAG: ABC transporter ATP-binding protein [Thiofilum sp.]|uniref:ABC transporter ATP-binding protein n=1 Tax=Thiofilum sp. TaxID=2212733 RepID=UPI0025D7433C|nr:ABC transporter ATP-binding protein [Thiofilum sp.]MBK8452101.1 ABC transporter ATP-binding protein [Thiofilum sp.]